MPHLAPTVDAGPSRLKRAKRALRYGAVRVALALLSLLPLRWAARLGGAFGALAFMLARRERQKALASLAQAFPDRSPAERVQLARGSFVHLATAAFELGCIRKLDAQVDAYVEWPPESRQVLEAALARKAGVVFVSGHVGHWELLARRIALAGFPCQTIAKETTDPRLTALVERFRASAGLRSIWRGHEGAARKMLRALKNGEILGLLIDQDTRVQSVFVPFFGKLAATPRAAADLALRAQAAVVLGFCPRQEDGRYRVMLEAVPLPQGEGDEAVVELTARLTQGIEKAIRDSPRQWVWMHQRWKTRPPGDEGSASRK